ncbi:MAG: phosphoheptose isomerase [Acidobacteria bacterium]|nr:phosphoheptose isomerase [Acidobacteriota bacterium]
MEFFRNCFSEITERLNDADTSDLVAATDLIRGILTSGGKIIVVGNGGSAAIASHLTVDLTKAAGIRTVNFNEPTLLTCFANDYGYEHWVEKALDYHADKGDLLILISSSGESANIANGARRAKALGLSILTLSGFASDNRLRSLGCVNLWVNSHTYNIVENVHQIWMLSIVDYLVADNVKGAGNPPEDTD